MIKQSKNPVRKVYSHLISIIFILPIVILAGCKHSEEQQKPGNTSLPSSDQELNELAQLAQGDYTYDVEDYFQKPAQRAFALSPDGQFLSYLQRDENGKSHLYVKHSQTEEITHVLEEKEDILQSYRWANNTRILYIQDKGGDENYHLFAVDIDGSNQIELTPFDGVRVEVIDELKEQSDYVIIAMNKEFPEKFEPYKLNIKNGTMEKLFENDDPTTPVTSYYFDKEGKLRAYERQKNGTEYILYYRTDSSQPFEIVVHTTWKNQFSILEFDYNGENTNAAYVLSNLNSDKSEVILYDLAKKKAIKPLFSNTTFDIDGISWSRKRAYEVDYYYYHGEKLTVVPVSKTYTKLHEKLERQFPGKQFFISSASDNEEKLLIEIESDKYYGAYYLYDTKKTKFKKVADLVPQLKEQDMAEMRPIKYKTRDGLTIYGYITIPKEASKTSKVPLIVNPHGGPYGVRDFWGFNSEAQLFASRGYATLQVNYRGSGGYGKQFYLAGSKQIGRKMLEDIEDGVAYVLSLEFIDRDRIAIFGGSYGGLATLGSLIKTPNLYVCGIDYVGVSNLFTFYKSFPPYWKPFLRQIREQWYDETIPEEQEIMKTISPALNISKLNKPLFVVQGANDPRVNINESDQIVEGLRKKNIDVPYMVKYNEGHGFSHENNRIELYSCMLGFFHKHLK